METKAYRLILQDIIVADSPEAALADFLKMLLGKTPNSCTFVEVWEQGVKIAIVDVQPILEGQELRMEELEWLPE